MKAELVFTFDSLDELLSVTSKLGIVGEFKQAAEPAKQAPVVKLPVKEAAKETKETKEPVKEAAQNAPTLEAIRMVVKEKAKAGHRAALLAILKQFGAATVPDLKPEDYENAFNLINDLGS